MIQAKPSLTALQLVGPSLTRNRMFGLREPPTEHLLIPKDKKSNLPAEKPDRHHVGWSELNGHLTDQHGPPGAQRPSETHGLDPTVQKRRGDLHQGGPMESLACPDKSQAPEKQTRAPMQVSGPWRPDSAPGQLLRHSTARPFLLPTGHSGRRCVTSGEGLQITQQYGIHRIS